MDIYSTRKENLAHLIQTNFGGKQVQLAEKMDIKPPVISRWLSSTTKDGRNITENSARAIEAAAGLPSGLLDREKAIFAKLLALADQIHRESNVKAEDVLKEIVENDSIEGKHALIQALNESGDNEFLTANLAEAKTSSRIKLRAYKLLLNSRELKNLQEAFDQKKDPIQNTTTSVDSNEDLSGLDYRIKPIAMRYATSQNKPDFYYLRQFAIGASAGTGQINYEIKEEDPFEISKAELIAQDINPETTFVIYVEGPSMTLSGHPHSMPDGSLIGFDRSKKKIISGKFYVVRIGDELLVKQVFQDQFTIQLRSLNPDFHPYDRVLQKSEGWQDVEILGQVKLMRPAMTFF